MFRARAAVKTIHTDLLVVGSGAGGLTAAVTAHHHGLKATVIEKSHQFGGASAWSGGGIWIPNSTDAQSKNPHDSKEQALTYMKSSIGEEVSKEKMRTFVEQAPQMLEFLQANTALNCEAIPYPDYYSNLPGAQQGYRTHCPKVFDGSKLGAKLYQIRPQLPNLLVQQRYTVTISEAYKILTQEKGWWHLLLKIILSYHLDIVGRLKSPMSRRMTQGHALVGSLYYSLLQKDGELSLNSAMEELIQGADGAVVGARVNREGEIVEIRSRCGVVLASGGFEHNQTLREQYLPEPSSTEWSISAPYNSGDALQAALRVGAQIDLMQHAWWLPVVKVPDHPQPIGLFVERSMPGLVIVNNMGKRFINEASPYMEVGQAMYQENSVPSWIIFDAKFRYKYPLGPLLPGWAMPDKRTSRKVMSVVTKAQSIAELADKINVDANGLEATIARNNHFATTGVDEDFKRGNSFYDRYYSDASHRPNPCIASIDKAPFYAMAIYPGDIGTKGGIVTNRNAQVQNKQGQSIPGLYATGNCAASVMGSKYVGAGATLGPAMTFGYVAALHALNSNTASNDYKK